MNHLEHSTEILATVLFACALVHTFMSSWFNRIAAKYPKGSLRENTLHFLGEVEIVFGLWAAIFLLAFGSLHGFAQATAFLESLSFTEPAFVFAIMVIAATRPVLSFSAQAVAQVAAKLAHILPLPGATSLFLLLLTVGPLAGSLITEPGAMTLTALLLHERILKHKCSEAFKYATLGLLFVNISIGGVLTPFAAPPVVMVAAKWNWNLSHMLANFGWRATLVVLTNAFLVCGIFWKELARMPAKIPTKGRSSNTNADAPLWLVMIHLAFLIGVVASAHHMTVFCGLLLMFLGVTEITREFQDSLRLRESLLVAFFLAGLVVLGKEQEWWLRPLLSGASDQGMFWGATGLTAITDNAALTYLASQVADLSESAKYAIVAGAVTGGGLTVIANAPNPAGYAILKDRYGTGGINPLKLFAAALIPTLIAAACFCMPSF